MKIARKDGTREREIVTALITNKSVLGRFANKWDGKLFQSQWGNTIAKWCFDYFEKYEKAPRRHITHLYEAWAEGADDPDTVKMVEKLLGSLSDEWEAQKGTNTEYLIDRAADYFNEIRLKRTAEAILGDLENGQLAKAQEHWTKWSKVEAGHGSYVDVLEDDSALTACFSDQAENLITYPGALGEFFDGLLTRDSLVSFEGPEKRGKTWWLIDVAWRAMLQKRKTAYFAVGDMSQNQMMNRFIKRAAYRPWDVRTYNYPRSIDREPDSAIASIDFEERETKHKMTKAMGREAFDLTLKKKRIGGQSMLRLSCYPNSSITVGGIESVLRGWERSDSWTPDVIVIDYADILAGPLPGQAESRDQVNATWKQLRALSQSWHNLVVTATQTDARSYNASVIDRSHFSEDKRKMAHVTAMIGLNASEEEKELGLMRLNHVVVREKEFSTYRCCHVAGCLSVGNPAIRSTF